jgi:NAD(P)-dependent dehydrogenase (short-subunit alcohol dehydrogenase family)
MLKYPGSRIHAIDADVTRHQDRADLINFAVQKMGGIDVLVNNAASLVLKPFVETTEDDFNAMLTGNVTSVAMLSRLAMPYLAKSRGNIINIASLAGIRSVDKFPGLSAYSASKAAVIALTECMAVELKELGIRANCIAPGAVDTEMLRKAAPNLNPRAKPIDIAKIVYYLADDEQSGIITGSTLEVFSNS